MKTTSERRVAILGTVAMVTTLVYTTVGLGLQAWRIVETGERPSLAMMVLAAATFLSWTVWAAVKAPVEKHVMIANGFGFGFSVLIITLTLSALPKPEPINDEYASVSAGNPTEQISAASMRRSVSREDLANVSRVDARHGTVTQGQVAQELNCDPETRWHP